MMKQTLPSKTIEYNSITLLLLLSILHINYCHQLVGSQTTTTNENPVKLNKTDDRGPGSWLAQINGTTLGLNLETAERGSVWDKIKNDHGKEVTDSTLIAHVEYGLLYRADFEVDEERSCKSKLDSLHENYTTDGRTCENIINTFDRLNRIKFAEKYCSSRRFETKEFNNQSFQHRINNLLPNLPYSFKIEFNNTSENTINVQTEEPQILTKCTNESQPMFSPRADLGSFIIKKKSSGYEFRDVELYWQPLPLLFVGSADMFHYDIDCFDESGNLTYKNNQEGESNRIKRRFGTVVIDSKFHINRTYQCNIRSTNKFGSSANESTIIIIPKQSYVIDTFGKFELFAAHIEGDLYKLKWNDINDIQENNHEHLEGTYTIYWFRPQVSLGYDYIELETNNTETTITIEGLSKTVADPLFGISFRSREKKFTGIHFSSCTTTNLEKTISEPYKINAISSLDNHTILSITWSLKDCESLIAAVEYHELTYCQKYSYESCSVQTTYLTNSTIQDFIPKDDNNCTTKKLVNNLKNEYSIQGLNGSTWYSVKVKPVIQGKETRWSETAFVSTTIEPEIMKKCHKYPLYKIIISISLLIGLLLLIYGVISFCFGIIIRFRKASAKLPARMERLDYEMDELSIADLKYWSNRCPTPTKPLGDSDDSTDSSIYDYEFDSKNMRVICSRNVPKDNNKNKKNKGSISPDKNAQDFNNQDYIPNQLFNDLGELQFPVGHDTSQESGRDNDSQSISLSEDDFSSSSNDSSFIANIINNNNPTFKPKTENNN